jgi:hypothetical protein
MTDGEKKVLLKSLVVWSVRGLVVGGIGGGTAPADWGGEFTADERRDYLHRLGNLSLLQKSPNGRIGNKSFAVKKPILAASKFALTAQIGAEAGWTKETIKKRQEELATLAATVWPR